MAAGARASTPEPLAAPPQPMATAVVKLLKTIYAAWVTAGGAPIYGNTPSAPTYAPQEAPAQESQ